MIIYLIKSGICLALLLAIYHLFLEKEKMHQFNRFYLLGSILFSFYAPYFIIYTDPIIINEAIVPLFSNILEIDSTYNNVISAPKNRIDFNLLFIVVYFLISSLLLFRFSKNLLKISIKIRNNKKSIYKNATIVLTSEKIIPHTFLHYIFINKKEFKKNAVEDELFTHELTHVSQKHTIDILLIELLHIICWFNPLIIYLKKAIKLNHEFIADDSVIHSHKNTTEYQHLLLNKATLKNNIYLASNFNYSLTKKRLIMMTKKSSQLKMLFKKIAIIPLTIGLLFLFANRVEAQQKTIVSKTETHRVHQEEVTPEMIKEYNSLAKKMKTIKNGHFKLKEIERIEFIYNLMTDKQKNGAEPYPNIPPPPTVKSIKVKNTPPPPPIPANATDDQKKVYKKAIKKYKKSKKEVKNIPPPPPIPAKVTKEQKKAYKKATEKYKKSQKELKNIPPPPPLPKKQIKANLKHKVQNKSKGNIEKPQTDSNGDEIIIGHQITDSSISENYVRHPSISNYTDYAEKFLELQTPRELDFNKLEKLYNDIPLSEKTSLMTPEYILNNKDLLKKMMADSKK